MKRSITQQIDVEDVYQGERNQDHYNNKWYLESVNKVTVGDKSENN